MAQYDIIFNQNTSVAGVEYTERTIAGTAGCLIVIGANNIPTVLGAGTDTYVLRSNGEGAIPTWQAPVAGHTQGTDTGTTGSSFDIDSDGTTNGVRLKTSSGVLELRNLADDGYADLSIKSLTVYGTTTTINATTITVDDKNIELGSVATPTDITADGGGITLKGDTDKTIIWDNANDNWSFNQAVNLTSGLTFKINNTAVLSATQVLGVTLGTMASETATSYVTKALYDANTVLFATSNDTPTALLGIELFPKLWATAPADKIGTGYTGTAIAGQMARDGNYIYKCDTGGAAGSQAWSRWIAATNW